MGNLAPYERDRKFYAENGILVLRHSDCSMTISTIL